MLLQTLADHLGGLARLEVLIVFELLILHFELLLILFFERPLLQFVFGLLADQLAFEVSDFGISVRKLLVLGLQRFCNSEFLLGIRLVQLRLEPCDLLLFLDQLLLPLVDCSVALFFLGLHRLGDSQTLFRFAAGQLRLKLLDQAIFLGELLILFRQFCLMALFLLHPGDRQLVFAFGVQLLLPAGQLLFKLLVPHLLGDLRIAGFVYLKHFAAVRAFDFLHIDVSPLVAETLLIMDVMVLSIR